MPVSFITLRSFNLFGLCKINPHLNYCRIRIVISDRRQRLPRLWWRQRWFSWRHFWIVMRRIFGILRWRSFRIRFLGIGWWRFSRGEKRFSWCSRLFCFVIVSWLILKLINRQEASYSVIILCVIRTFVTIIILC